MEDISHQESIQSKYSLGGLYSLVISRFFCTLDSMVSEALDAIENPHVRVLEVGCGEGEVLERLSSKLINNETVVGFDIDGARIKEAYKRLPWPYFCEGSAYSIPMDNLSVDLAICCEVLEHLENPQGGLLELARVVNGYIVLSVPREPVWRVLNFLRGKYIRDFGNTPGHINHWSSGEFVDCVSSYFDVVRVETPLPWTVVLAKKKGA